MKLNIPTAVVFGKIMWIGDPIRNNPFFSGILIAILLDDEPEPERENGLKPLRSINLVGEAEQFFNEYRHFISKGQDACFEVISDNLQRDLSSGKGLLRRGKFRAIQMTI